MFNDKGKLKSYLISTYTQLIKCIKLHLNSRSFWKKYLCKGIYILGINRYFVTIHILWMNSILYLLLLTQQGINTYLDIFVWPFIRQTLMKILWEYFTWSFITSVTCHIILLNIRISFLQFKRESHDVDTTTPCLKDCLRRRLLK